VSTSANSGNLKISKSILLKTISLISIIYENGLSTVMFFLFVW
jgi:hypothetical protein